MEEWMEGVDKEDGRTRHSSLPSHIPSLKYLISHFILLFLCFILFPLSPLFWLCFCSSSPHITTPSYLTFLSHFAVFPNKLAASSLHISLLSLYSPFSFHPSFTTPFFLFLFLPSPFSCLPHFILLSNLFCLLLIPPLAHIPPSWLYIRLL